MTSTKGKYDNISIQLVPYQRQTPNKKFELPHDETLSESELNRKSTSDRTKRRVAHVPSFPKPISSVTKPRKQKKDQPTNIKPQNTRVHILPKSDNLHHAATSIVCKSETKKKPTKVCDRKDGVNDITLTKKRKSKSQNEGNKKARYDFRDKNNKNCAYII